MTKEENTAAPDGGMLLSRRRTVALGLAAGVGAVAAGRAGSAPAAAALPPGETVGPYALPPLRYGYAALEPVIDQATVRLQHDVHHRGYVERVNTALARHPAWLGLTIEDVLRRLRDIPADIREEVRNQGGGHANHQFFFKVVAPRSGPGPSGDLLAALNRDFGSVDNFKRQFEAAAMNQAGNGWVFLVSHSAQNNKLDVLTLPNNDSVLSLNPPARGLAICDLWDHAYAAKYGTRRADWVKAYWDIVDWPTIGQRYLGVMNSPPRVPG